jgi:gas vesicle protein
MADSGKILSALFIGAAAGAAVGLLFAPDKGTETRRRLAGAAQDLADQAADRWSEGKTALKNVRDRVSNTAEELAEKATNRVDSLKGKAEDLVDGARTEARRASNV